MWKREVEGKVEEEDSIVAFGFLVDSLYWENDVVIWICAFPFLSVCSPLSLSSLISCYYFILISVLRLYSWSLRDPCIYFPQSHFEKLTYCPRIVWQRSVFVKGNHLQDADEWLGVSRRLLIAVRYFRYRWDDLQPFRIKRFAFLNGPIRMFPAVWVAKGKAG